MELNSQSKEKLDDMLQSDVITLLSDKPNDLVENIKILTKLKKSEDYFTFIKDLKEKYKYSENGASSYLETVTGEYHLKGIDKQIDLEVLSEKEIEGLVDNLGDYITASLFYDKKKLNYEQTEYLTEVIRSKYKKLIFVVTPSTTLKGKIINQEWQGKITIPIAYNLIGLKSSKNDESVYDLTDQGVKYKETACLYATSFDKRKWGVCEELKEEYYGYRFYDEENHKEVLVLSRDKIENTEVIEGIEGLLVYKKDSRIVGSDSRLSCYTNVLHLTNFHVQENNYIRCVNSIASVRDKKLSDEYICSTIYNQYRHPKWFERLVLYVLFSGKREYPLHFFILNPGAGGKTTLFERIAKVMGLGSEEIWDGEQSTTKSLIPNFTDNPPDCGFMARQKHIGLLDEFFGRTSSDDNNYRKRGEYGTVKTILEHKRRIGRSGKGNVDVIPTAQFFLGSNYKFGINNLASLMDKTDEAFVERILVYFQNEEHANFISEHKSNVNLSQPNDETDLFPYMKGVILYFKSFVIDGIEPKRIIAMKESIENIITYDSVLRNAIQTYLKARCDHHLILLLDGIAKFRCYCQGIIDKDKIKPIDADYEELKNIMEMLAQSWARSTDISSYSLNARVNLLGLKARKLYDWVHKNNGRIMENDFVNYALQEGGLTKEEYGDAIKTLLDWGILLKDEGFFYCFWWKPKEQWKSDRNSKAISLLECISAEGTKRSIIESNYPHLKDELDSILNELKVSGHVFEPIPGLIKKVM